MVQSLKKPPDPRGPAELAIDLGNIIGGLPSHGYLIIGDLPDGSRLSHGHDNGDKTWTLMFDELAGLKFLPGPARGIVSLKTQIFSLDPGARRSPHTTRQRPLIVHTDDGFLWSPPEPELAAKSSGSSTTSMETKSDACVVQAAMLEDGRNAPGTATRSFCPTDAVTQERESAMANKLEPCSDHIGPATAVTEKASRDSAIVPARSSGAVQLFDSAAVETGGPGVGQAAQTGSARFLSKTEKRWTDEVDRLFRKALGELRREAEEALTAAERRHTAEITELSGAIMKQHEVIAALKRDAEQAKHKEASRLSEAEHRWQHAEAERMNAARKVWAREKEDLKREADRQRSGAEKLTGALAALKAEGESKEREFEKRLKEMAAEAERAFLSARAGWQSEVARCLETAGIQIRAAFERAAPYKK